MIEDKINYDEIYLGESEAFREFKEKLHKIAKIDRSVLVIGERGTGKEIAANIIHVDSSRWQKKLVTINCAALTPSLIESELFGYEKGAFTGASTSGGKGRFEEAEGGTIFFDEIGMIPISIQTKLLRVVEYGTYEKVGSSKTQKANVRIIGATNLDLKKLCDEGKFKRDLLDRLSFEVVYAPPLRERDKDIMLLAHHFANAMAIECGNLNEITFSKGIIESLNSYNWPGNVRELKNVIERAVYKCQKDKITEIVLDPFKNPYKNIAKNKLSAIVDMLNEGTISNLEKVKQSIDILYLKSALNKAENNQKKAAEMMGLSYDQFRGFYRKYKNSI